MKSTCQQRSLLIRKLEEYSTCTWPDICQSAISEIVGTTTTTLSFSLFQHLWTSTYFEYLMPSCETGRCSFECLHWVHAPSQHYSTRLYLISSKVWLLFNLTGVSLPATGERGHGDVSDDESPELNTGATNLGGQRSRTLMPPPPRPLVTRPSITMDMLVKTG